MTTTVLNLSSGGATGQVPFKIRYLECWSEFRNLG
jgi:hypothetical protein